MTIHWPADLHPSRAAVHVANEIEIAAAPETVWSCLIRAEKWPNWYPNARGVKVLKGPSPELGLRSRFRWKTFGLGFESFVEEFKAPERIAWNAERFGLTAYHAWMLERTPGGCRVITEETQRGWLARLGKMLFPKRMHEQHQIWLERLKQKAEAGTAR